MFAITEASTAATNANSLTQSFPLNHTCELITNAPIGITHGRSGQSIMTAATTPKLAIGGHGDALN
jgi:hypothetical protein